MTGFVFKIQTNRDRNHRDRIAFKRVCSGKLSRGMKAKLVCTGKMVAARFSSTCWSRRRASRSAAGSPARTAEIDKFSKAHGASTVEDFDGSPVFMAPSAWDISYETKRWPEVRFVDVKDCQREMG